MEWKADMLELWRMDVDAGIAVAVVVCCVLGQIYGQIADLDFFPQLPTPQPCSTRPSPQ